VIDRLEPLPALLLLVLGGCATVSSPRKEEPMPPAIGGHSFKLLSGGSSWFDAYVDVDGTRIAFGWPKDEWNSITVITAAIQADPPEPHLALFVRHGVSAMGGSDATRKDTEYAMPIAGAGGFPAARFEVPVPGSDTLLVRVVLEGKRAAFFDPEGRLRMEIRPLLGDETRSPEAMFLQVRGRPVLLFRAFGSDGKPEKGAQYLMP
jgi:hypothetical protein